MNKKTLLKLSRVVCVAGVVATGLILVNCTKKNPAVGPAQGPTVNFTVDLNQPSSANLNTGGGTLSLNGVLMVNNNGTFIAIAQACTQDGCKVGYNQSYNSFVCPCEGDTYDINGNIASGSQPAPLKKYTVTQSGKVLTVKG